MYKIVKKPTIYRKETVTKVYSYLRIGKVFHHDYKHGIYLISTSNGRIKYFYSKGSIPIATASSLGLEGYVVYINIDFDNESDRVLYVDQLSNFKDIGIHEDYRFVSDDITVPEKYIVRVPNGGNRQIIEYYIGYKGDYIIDAGEHYLIDSPTHVDDDSRLLLEYYFSVNEFRLPSSSDYLNLYQSLLAKINTLDINAIFNSLRAELSIKSKIRGGRSSFSDEETGSADISTSYVYYDSYLELLLPTVNQCLYKWSGPYMRKDVDGGYPPTSAMIEKWNSDIDKINQDYNAKIPQAIGAYNQDNHVFHLMRAELADKYAQYYNRNIEIEQLKQRVDVVFYKSFDYWEISVNKRESNDLFTLIRQHNMATF